MAANMLAKYAENFRKGIDVDLSAKKKISADAYNNYDEVLKAKKPISCTFELADSEGNLSLVDSNGITVVLPAETFKESTPYYSKKIKDRFIGTMALNVVVKNIDRENGIVTVESAVGKDQIKGTLIKNIFQELKKGNHPRLGGIVMSVTDKRATVNILNKNIMGLLNVANWQPIYTRSLKEFVQRGDYIEFEVTEAATKKPGVDYAFYLDRKNIAPDPWEGLTDFPAGSAIVCKCVDKPKNKDYWWGVSASVPGIEIICDYSQHVSVMLSCYYKCKVRQYDREKHVLKVVPFEVVPTGIATAENINFALNKK